MGYSLAARCPGVSLPLVSNAPVIFSSVDRRYAAIVNNGLSRMPSEVAGDGPDPDVNGRRYGATHSAS